MRKTGQHILSGLAVLLMALTAPQTGTGQTAEYDLLIKGGRVLDPRNSINAVRDVAVKDGRIAAVAENLPAARAVKTVDAAGLYVTPGLIDIHVHVYPGLIKNDYAAGDWSVYPDGYTLRNCVTTVADAGTSGWRTFDDFKSRIIDRSTSSARGWDRAQSSRTWPIWRWRRRPQWR
jgi:predicted amidohydrolase